jgi:hypothetical protein
MTFHTRPALGGRREAAEFTKRSQSLAIKCRMQKARTRRRSISNHCGNQSTVCRALKC